MAATMTDVRALAAAEFVANVLTGKTFEQISDQVARVSTGIISSQLDTSASIIVGDSVILDNQVISGADRFPELDRDLIFRGTGTFGDRIVVSLRAVTAVLAANPVVTLVEVETLEP